MALNFRRSRGRTETRWTQLPVRSTRVSWLNTMQDSTLVSSLIESSSEWSELRRDFERLLERITDGRYWNRRGDESRTRKQSCSCNAIDREQCRAECIATDRNDTLVRKNFYDFFHWRGETCSIVVAFTLRANIRIPPVYTSKVEFYINNAIALTRHLVTDVTLNWKTRRRKPLSLVKMVSYQ